MTTENDSDEILTLDRPSITVRDHVKGRACCVLATGDFARSESTSLQESNSDKNEHMPDEHKTLEQRIADTELNLKKLREEIIGAYISWEGKIVLEQSPTPTPEQPKQTPAPPKKKP